MKKRYRKGLGDLKPRNDNIYFQMIHYGTTIGLVKTMLAPLERVKILLQVSHMQNIAVKD